MKTKVIVLRNNIQNNIDRIKMDYPTIDELLWQLNIILKMDMTNERIEEWFISNKYAIRIINEILKNILILKK